MRTIEYAPFRVDSRLQVRILFIYTQLPGWNLWTNQQGGSLWACCRACKYLRREWLVISAFWTSSILWRRWEASQHNFKWPPSLGCTWLLGGEWYKLGQIFTDLKDILIISICTEFFSLQTQCSFQSTFKTFAGFGETLSVKASHGWTSGRGTAQI